MDDGKFKLKKKTLLDDSITELPESDLTIQTDSHLLQFEYISGDEKRKPYIIKPGCFMIEDGAMGTVLKPFTLRRNHLLESIDNTSMILSESNKFFNRLNIYKELKREPKRALLLASVPGVGKSASINKVCEIFLEDPGTVVVIWDTSDVRSSSVNKFFLNRSKFHKDVKRMIFVMEDIGGGTVEEYGGSRGADSSLLNLLDGVGSPFHSVPTFIIATTNNPEQSVGALIDRPGRFDKVILMETPNKQECEQLLEFITKRKLTESDKKAAEIASQEKFSIAHLQEVVVRSLLDDISTEESALQLKKHKQAFAKAFSKTNSIGIGM